MCNKTNRAINGLKAFIRNPYALSYHKHLVMADGGYMCHKCAKDNYREILIDTRANLKGDWQTLGEDVYWEGPVVHCCNCIDLIESIYGDTDNEVEPNDYLHV